MMRAIVGILVAVVAVCPGLRAQQVPRALPAFWVQAGPALGFGKVSCDGCIQDRSAGIGVNFGTGVQLAKLELGVVVDGWWKTEAQERWRIASILGSVRIYPLSGAGLFVDGGAGWGRYVAKLDPDSDDRARADGFAWSIGAGYRVRLSDEFTFEPFLKYIDLPARDLMLDGATTGIQVHPTLVSGGIVLRWRWKPASEKRPAP